MSGSTNFISGLSSGIDWNTMITQLIAVDHKQVDVIGNKKADYENKLSQWQSLNAKLLALKNSVRDLKSSSGFAIFKISLSSDSASMKANDLLTVSTDGLASTGFYTVKINRCASAQKLSSTSFSSASAALGSDYAGDIILNGVAITIEATDTLNAVKEKINSTNAGTHPTGVTAGIVKYGNGDYRLILTSDTTGAEGIDLRNGGNNDICGLLGFTDSTRTAKHHLAGGDMSDRFTSATIAIGTLLNLTSAQSSEEGDIVINGRSVGSINLAQDSLTDIQSKLTAAGVTASIVTEVEGGRTYYRLLITGVENSYKDNKNILETLGILEGGHSEVFGVTGDVANTSAGKVITSSTYIKNIDGFTGYSATDYIRLEGTDTAGNSVLDDSFILSDVTTVGDLLTKIESLFGNVTASITGDGKLRIVDNTTGASTLSVKMSVRNEGGELDGTLRFDSDGDLGSAVSVRKREIVAGTDASVTIDGVEVTSSSNTIVDAIPGVTLNLLKADAGVTVNIQVERDFDAIVSKVRDFITAYNSVASFIRTQCSFDETTKKAGGVLFGDGTLTSVRSDLTSIITNRVWGVSSEFSTLGLVGVSVDRYGQLSLDEGSFKKYLGSNFGDVRRLFTAEAISSTSTIEYVSHTINTKCGEHNVVIEQIATRSTSSASDNTTLNGDEVLTITEGSQGATITLTGGMTMDQIVAAITSELSSVHTQIIVGSERLFSDANCTAPITASTKWNSVYISSGESAHLANGDVISFTGVTREGDVVEGSYTISNVSGDSVQGLLSAIEAAFGNKVSAYIDSSGRIAIADNEVGTSSLSLSFDCSRAHDLDFGSVSTENEGGQKGRYAMSITAEKDAEGRLVLYHNNYGSAYRFAIHQKNNLLWTSGDQTVDNGQDVAGTIHGESATGRGQLLIGADDATNVRGLVIRYTGATTGDVGSLKLTFGVAELLDRVLFHITDQYEGYVSFKQQSLKDNITTFNNQIAEMEKRLEKRRLEMINRFVRMELAIQKVQAQSNWLASQLNSLLNIWKQR